MRGLDQGSQPGSVLSPKEQQGLETGWEGGSCHPEGGNARTASRVTRARRRGPPAPEFTSWTLRNLPGTRRADPQHQEEQRAAPAAGVSHRHLSQSRLARGWGRTGTEVWLRLLPEQGPVSQDCFWFRPKEVSGSSLGCSLTASSRRHLGASKDVASLLGAWEIGQPGPLAAPNHMSVRVTGVSRQRGRRGSLTQSWKDWATLVSGTWTRENQKEALIGRKEGPQTLPPRGTFSLHGLRAQARGGTSSGVKTIQRPRPCPIRGRWRQRPGRAAEGAPLPPPPRSHHQAAAQTLR